MPTLSDRNYNVLKQSAQLFLPALAALYFALAQIWGLPAGDKVTGTIAAINVFVGVVVYVAKLLHDATGAKYDGTVDVVATETGGKRFVLNLEGDPDDLDKKAEITFRVNNLLS